ncbi:S1C family serine protease [Sphingorhabdus sp.]|uniref:S1C family serine protease n=1 Tax=Sphingorhabdus sp. TaxID=1902408 RepID=UPI003341B6BA
MDNIMRYLAVFFLFLAPVLVVPAFADASDISAASRSVVRVVVFSTADGQQSIVSIGSGVAVARDKIVTNAHVVEMARGDDSAQIVIVPSDGAQSYRASVVASLSGKDLALLQLKSGSLVPASIFAGVIADGADVFAIGYPASVDIALEQSEADVLRPQQPVKTRGTVSSGRTSKTVESLLHTAPIAPGNSGGPIVDACGRVLGINSFGSVPTDGGAEFYFAISARELTTFLANRGIEFRSVRGDCRSVADLTRAEAELEASTRVKIDKEARVAAELQRSREGKVRSDAEHAVIAERENYLALAALLLVVSALAGGAAWQFAERSQRDRFKAACAAGAVIFVMALGIFAARPSFNEVDDRVRAVLTADTPDNAVGQKTAVNSLAPVAKICILQPERSRVTMSDTADVAFTWQSDGCVNGRTQYVENGDRWIRSFVPNNDAQISVVSYFPETEIYRIERFLPGNEAMQSAREARQLYDVKTCTADQSQRTNIDNMNKAIATQLPPTPNEILLFTCSNR